MSEAKPKTVPSFDRHLLQQLLAERQTAGEIEDRLKDLRKAFIEHALQGELTHHLGYEKHAAAGRNTGNSRNGSTPKTIRTDEAEVTIQIPHDRRGEFTPQLIGKHQRRWEGFDETILSLYAHGLSTRDIQSFLQTKYDIAVSPEFISSVCESVSAGVKEWRQRPLAAVWPIVYLDALFLKVRDEGKVVTKALYVAVGVNLQGRKELLGLWLGQPEGAKFWLQILTELKGRGVSDILILCVDGLAARSDCQCLSPSDDSDLCRASGTPQFELRPGQRAQSRGRRLEAHLPSSERSRRPPSAGAFSKPVGQEISGHRQILARQLESRQADV